MSDLHPAVSSRDHISGDTNAPIVLVEYGDYQCPYCGDAYPVTQELVRRYGDKIAFAFRNFPLVEAHPEAFNAAIVAEFAASLGQFWPAHDALYENQDALGPELYGQIVASLGQSAEQFQAAVDAGELEARVRQDMESGLRSGVNGTPCFFINGQRFDPRGGFESLLDAVGQLVERT
jgi:protein-disulfide isomerase